MASNKIKSAWNKLFPSKKDADLEHEASDGLSTQEVMEAIYTNKTWGGRKHDFYSGQGSHLDKIVNPYVKKITQFLETFEPKLTVCDLGCGDFNVGSRLVAHSDGYIGVDIVPQLIERNKQRFQDAGLEFQCLNIVTDTLPEADCVLVRQVLQHLSNDEIARVVPKLEKFKYVIVTEHLPKGDFVPNLDKKTGANIRLSSHSGVVLHEAPFDFKPMKQRELIQVHIKKGQVVTSLYQNF